MDWVINFLGYVVVYVVAVAVVASWIWALVNINKLNREWRIFEEARLNMNNRLRGFKVVVSELERRIEDRHGQNAFQNDRVKLALGMAKKAIREQRAAEDQQAFCLNQINARLDNQRHNTSRYLKEFSDRLEQMENDCDRQKMDSQIDSETLAGVCERLDTLQARCSDHGAQMVSLREDVGEYMIKVESVEEGAAQEIRNLSENMGHFSAQWVRESEWFFEVIKALEKSIEALKKGKANKVTPAPANKSPRAKNGKAG